MSARRAMTRESVPLALISLVRRNRRRYGGYLVHVGMAVLLVGVAASSGFADKVDARLAPGQSARVGDHVVTYERPVAEIVTRAGALERIELGAVLRVTRDGQTVVLTRPTRGYYPSQDVAGLGALGRFFEGASVSEIGLDPGLARDVWTAVQPDIEGLQPIIDEGDQVFAQAADALPPAIQARALGQVIQGLVRSYRDAAPPAQFRLMVSPMVAYVWLGALIVLAGGAICLWPAPGAIPARCPARRPTSSPWRRTLAWSWSARGSAATARV